MFEKCTLLLFHGLGVFFLVRIIADQRWLKGHLDFSFKSQIEFGIMVWICLPYASYGASWMLDEIIVILLVTEGPL